MAVAATMLSGCALYTRTSFTEYRGQPEFTGRGGTVKHVDGIEFWTSGEPNRRFKVLGFIDQSHYNNRSLLSLIANANNDSELIATATKHGGDAIMFIGADSVVTGYSTTSFAQGQSTGMDAGGVLSDNSSAYGSATTHANKWDSTCVAVIEYLD
jgi:hypothetical protein